MELTAERIELIAHRFKLLAEPMRLRLLNELRDGPLTVGELVDRIETSQANVSKHLGLLRRGGLVSRTKDGPASIYSISDPAIFALCDLVCRGLEDETADRLRVLGG